MNNKFPIKITLIVIASQKTDCKYLLFNNDFPHEYIQQGNTIEEVVGNILHDSCGLTTNWVAPIHMGVINSDEIYDEETAVNIGYVVFIPEIIRSRGSWVEYEKLSQQLKTLAEKAVWRS